MKKIIPLELAGQDYLSTNLYNENGSIILERGERLNPGLLMELNFKKIYIDERELENKPIFVEEELPSLISEKAAETLLKGSKKILEDSLDGKTPDETICKETTDQIIQEVNDSLEKVECITQLRVHDEYTFSHTINVSTISSAIGLTLGLSEEDIKDLTYGALLHDIGKMRIPPGILNKPGRLTNEEFDVIRTHPIHGYEIIKNEMHLPEKIARIALEHHEKYSGGGYPENKKDSGISRLAQITSVADVYDALISKRPYKDGLPNADAIRIMLKDGSQSFNPSVLYKFVYMANYKNKTELVSEKFD